MGVGGQSHALCVRACVHVCVKNCGFGIRGPGICSARIFPVAVQEQSEANKLVEND